MSNNKDVLAGLSIDPQDVRKLAANLRHAADMLDPPSSDRYQFSDKVAIEFLESFDVMFRTGWIDTSFGMHKIMQYAAKRLRELSRNA
jgi:hypothetical protein